MAIVPINPNDPISVAELIKTGLGIISREMGKLKELCECDGMRLSDHKLLREYIELLTKLPRGLKEAEKAERMKEFGDDLMGMSSEELEELAKRASSAAKLTEPKALPEPEIKDFVEFGEEDAEDA